jgi:hypothetical protein
MGDLARRRPLLFCRAVTRRFTGRVCDFQVSDAAVSGVPPLLSPLAVARVLPVIATPD